MEKQKETKKYNRKPTRRQALATKILSEDVRISVSEAKRRAGYSESEALKPQRLTRSKAYSQVLDEAGLTVDFLAKEHRRALDAVEIRERDFVDRSHTELVEIDDDHPKWDSAGPKKQFKEETVYDPFTDKEIRSFFKNIPGAKLLIIEQNHRRRTAVYTMPSYNVRSKYHELSYKNKGLLAPEKHEHFISDELPDDEAEFIKSIGLTNDKKDS